MSWYYATLYAYDVMDRVQITAQVRSTSPGPEGTIETRFHSATTIPSVGETDPREWLRDVLVGALEDL